MLLATINAVNVLFIFLYICECTLDLTYPIYLPGSWVLPRKEVIEKDNSDDDQANEKV